MATTEEKSVEKIEKVDKVEQKPDPTDQISVTRHTLKIGRKSLAYTVTCGTMVMREEAEKEGKSEGEKARAKVFFIAYTLDPGLATAGAGSQRTNSRFSTSPTSSSSIPSAPASAA